MSEVFSREIVAATMEELKIGSLSSATIGQMLLLAATLERKTGIPFVRMDQGIPGLKPCEIGMAAEKEAHENGVASLYPAAEGVKELKDETSRFIKAFINVDVAPASCIPTTGSVAGSFGAFAICSQLSPQKNTILFIDPGFPIQKSQLNLLGVKYRSFDVFEYRGEALRAKLEEELCEGNIAAIVYSSPNNPTWITFTEQELEIIGTMATKYDVIIHEDLAYFGLDSRENYGIPFQAPYVPTVARYTDNYILFLSSSKIYSYAGQRVAVACVGNALFNRIYPELAKRYNGGGHFGITFTNAIMYMITSGVTHSAQVALAAMFRASSDGEFNFVEATKEYAHRAVKMKEILHRHGFNVVYDKDIDREIGDGFFFTMGYGDMSCSELVSEFVHYGISSISLSTTGSLREGVRACTSRMTEDKLEMFDERLAQFAADHPKK
ncbi:MAG: pyridoxal phosphate-dependent aminotransferase [Rikenellaceae bacterium]